jgi:orotate phosphoribosyltransferase
MDKVIIAQQLHEIGVIKRGNFTLKSGATSPIYFDLRAIVSYPHLLKAVADSLWQCVKDVKTDRICGVPYTALPIATVISIANNIPMVMVRKEVKKHGTGQQVEGHYEPGQNCIVIEDVVTTGGSVLTTVEQLRAVGLQVSEVVAFLDRENGGKENLAKAGCRLTSVFRLNELLSEYSTC